MPERPALPDRRLVVDCRDPMDQILVERHFLDHHAVFCCFPDLVPDFEINRMRHPIVERRTGKHGHVVPFHRVDVFRLRLRDSLNEREQVNPLPYVYEAVERLLRLLQELVSLSVEENNSDELSTDLNFFAADFQRLPAFPPTVGYDAAEDDHFRKLVDFRGIPLSRPATRTFPNTPAAATRSSTGSGTVTAPSSSSHNKPPLKAASVML